MKYILLGFGLATASALTLTACQSVNWKVGASCDTTKKCEAHGEVSGQFPQLRFADMQLLASAVADAAQFQLDITGSTVPYPTTGTVNIVLKNSGDGTIQAAKLFAWTKVGNIIKLTDPNAVNAWANANAGSADTVSYNMTKFASNYGYGPQTIAVKSKYEGAVTATASSSFERCTPPGVNSPYPCHM